MSKKYRLGIYFPILILAIIAAVALRTEASISSYNFVYGYYYGSVTFNISVGLCVAASLFLFSSAFLKNKSKEPDLIFGTPALYFPSAFICIGLIFTSINLISELKSASSIMIYGNVFSVPSNLVALISALLALAAILYFVFACITVETFSSPRAVFGMIAALFFVSYASYLYFNTELAINAHSKSIDQLAYVFTAVFFLFETRISLKRQSWRFYVAFGYVAALICAYSSIPSIIVYFINGKALSDSIYESVMTFSAFLFILARLLQTAFLRNNECCQSALSAIAASQAKAKGTEEHDDSFMKIIEESEASRLEERLAEKTEQPEQTSSDDNTAATADDEDLPVEESSDESSEDLEKDNINKQHEDTEATDASDVAESGEKSDTDTTRDGE